MASPDHLRLRDLRAAYRLMGECCELGRDARAWRLHMLEGLRRLTGSQVALYMLLHDQGTVMERTSDCLDVGFLDDAERALWADYQQSKAHLDDPFHNGFLRGCRGSLRTRRLTGVVHLDEWYKSRHYNDYVRACRLDDRITTSLPLPDDVSGALQMIVLHRAAADGKHSRRDQRLVHIFHHELGRLLGTLALPEMGEQRPDLPIRLQQVLACLLEGDSEKRIAARLALSPHTVNHHVQRLYRQLGVHSRSELMVQCAHLVPTATRRNFRASGGAAQKVVTGLISGGLAAEAEAGPVDPFWREEADGRGITLVATDAAAAALGLETHTGAEGAAEAPSGLAPASAPAETTPAPRRAPAPREGTKQAQLIAMLRRPEGATIAEITDATGWQPHTVRGAIAGALKKRLGLQMMSAKVDGRGRVYSIGN